MIPILPVSDTTIGLLSSFTLYKYQYLLFSFLYVSASHLGTPFSDQLISLSTVDKPSIISAFV
jgi:hypothetical protein